MVIDTSFGTMGSVALRIIEDFNLIHNGNDEKRYLKHPRKRMNKYTLDQTIEKVIFRNESIYSCEDYVPSYIWWYMGIDDAFMPIIHNAGKLSFCWKHGTENTYRYVFPAEQISDCGTWGVTIGEPDYEVDVANIMISYGLSFEQKVLTRYIGSWHTDYYGESDYSHECEIIYIEHSDSIDIPHMISNVKPKFSGLRVES